MDNFKSFGFLKIRNFWNKCIIYHVTLFSLVLKICSNNTLTKNCNAFFFSIKENISNALSVEGMDIKPGCKQHDFIAYSFCG